MPAIVQAAHAVGGPGNDMRYAVCNLLLAARAAEGLGRAGATDPAYEPFAIAVRLTARHPADGSVQIELGAFRASAMRSGHAPIVAGSGKRKATADAAEAVELRRRSGSRVPPYDRGNGR